MRIGMDEDALKEKCVMNSGMDEDSYDVPASVNAIAAAEAAKRTPVPVVDSTDGEALRRLAQEHTATGRPVLIRHAPLAARVASGVAVDRLSGLFSLFGKVNDNDSNFAYNIKLQAKTVFRDEMLKLAQLMALQSASDSADLTYMGERLRYNRRGKEFHAGPGFNYKFLLMVKGKKRWDFVAPEFTPFMSSFEAEMCGIRSVFRSADDLDTLHPSLQATTVPEVHTGIHEEGMVLLFSSQWWHSTHNLTDETFQVSNKFKNTRVYNEWIQRRKIERDKEKAARGLPEDYCSVKTEQNMIGTLMWSHSFFSS